MEENMKLRKGLSIQSNPKLIEVELRRFEKIKKQLDKENLKLARKLYGNNVPREYADLMA